MLVIGSANFFLLLIISLFAFVSAASASGDAIEAQVPNLEGVSERTTRILVYLPKNYNETDKDFPVAYFLHGFGSDAGAWERLNGPQSLGDRDLIIVSVGAGDSGYADWEDGENLGQTAVTNYVVPYVDAHFRTIKSPAGRGIFGQSMGGNAALRMAMTRPELFSCAAAHSAALQPINFDDLPDFAREFFEQGVNFTKIYGDPFKPEAWRRLTAAFHAVSMPADDLKKANYYFDVGVDDHLGFAQRNAALSAALSKKGVPHTFALREGGHNAAFTIRNIPNSLNHMFDCFEARSDKNVSE